MSKSISAIRGMSANEMLRFCGQENRVPVDIRAIMQTLGISSIAFDFSDLEKILPECQNDNHILGALATNGENTAIFYSTKDRENSHRYRFTIAHELGHCCLNHFPVDKSTTHLVFRKDGEAKDKKEIAANVFAGELLIPEKSLIDIIGELYVPSVRILSEIFDVSDNVMLERIKFLGLKEKIVGYNC